MEDKNSSGKSGSNTIGYSFGCGCLTTLVLVFMMFKYLYPHSSSEKYATWRSIVFFKDLLGVPVLLIVSSAAFEGVFGLIRSLRKKKKHGEAKDSPPVDGSKGERHADDR